MPAIPRQRRYDQVMGDREPKVTDKRFVVELQQRLEDKYMTSQCQKEKKLAEAESRRIRKLVLDGVIDAEDAHRSHGTQGRAQEWKELWPPNPHKSLAEYEEDKKRKAAEEGNRGGHQEHEMHQHHMEYEHAEHDGAATNGAAETAEGREGGNGSQNQQPPQPAGRYESSRPPCIDQLMVEEDLDELYRKASEIVYVMALPQKGGKSQTKR